MLADLLYEMGITLGYDFDKVRLKKNIYVPQGHGELDDENRKMRKGLIDVLAGKRFFPVQIFNQPSEEPDQKQPDSNDS